MKLTWPTNHAPVDREAILAAQVAENVRCGSCMTLRVGAGCACDRFNLFGQHVAALQDWAEEQAASLAVDPERGARIAYSLAAGAIMRAARRYGQDPQAAMIWAKRKFGIKPNAHPPRVWEQNHLPV
jgi:hypothetical protein